MEGVATRYKKILPDVTFVLVNTPNKLNEKNEIVRADTRDTFDQWWQEHNETIIFHAHHQADKKFPVTIVTNQPYGPYQLQQAIAAFYDKPINIFLIAGSIQDPENINLALVGDSYARTIYAGKNVILEQLINMNPAGDSECNATYIEG